MAYTGSVDRDECNAMARALHTDNTVLERSARKAIERPARHVVEYRRMLALDAFKVLCERIDALVEAITKTDADRPAVLWPIPPGGIATERAWDGPTLTGRDARTQAARVIAACRVASDQHPSTVIRAAGVIAASATTCDRARHVNEAKDAFERAAQAIAPRRQRRAQELQAIVPGIARRQIARHVRVCDDPPAGIQFFWARRTASVAPIRVGDYRRELLDGDVPPGMSEQQWDRLRQTALRILADESAQTWLARRHRLPSHPRAYLHPALEYSHGARQLVPAPLPFLVSAESGALPRIDGLDALSPDDDTGTARADQQLEYEPLIRGLGIYRYRRER